MFYELRPHYECCFLGVGVLDGLLYAVGGHDGPLVRKSVEYYSPEEQIWKQIADMHLCRRNAGMFKYNNNNNNNLLFIHSPHPIKPE